VAEVPQAGLVGIPVPDDPAFVARVRVLMSEAAAAAYEQAAAAGSPAIRPAAAEQRACKTEGCPNAANDDYDRGVYAGLCEEVCIPARRAELSEKTRLQHAAARNGKAKWTQAVIVDAIKLWAREHGRFPLSSDMAAADERFPPYATVVRAFPRGWSAALAAAGCPADVPHGRVRVDRDGTVHVEGDDPPKPELTEPSDEAPADPESLVTIAADLEDAWARYTQASEDLSSALRRLTAHPLFVDLAECGIFEPSDFARMYT
jgi:hypothetical protein